MLSTIHMCVLSEPARRGGEENVGDSGCTVQSLKFKVSILGFGIRHVGGIGVSGFKVQNLEFVRRA